MKYKLPCLLFILFCKTVALAQLDSAYPSWINTKYNLIYYNDSIWLKNTICSFAKKQKPFTILHIGDSHLQNENLPNQSRKMFQNVQGDGGIGLIVPFSTVKSYDARFYKSTHTGTWHYSKSYMGKFDYPMGVRGMTSYTNDSLATFKMVFNAPVSNANNELLVFREKSDSTFDVDFYTDGIIAQLKYSDDNKVIYNVKGGFTELRASISKGSSLQTNITITGLILQDSLHRGGIWHNAGVGAAPYRMVLSEELYETQAKYINPDLVIIDLGTNDFLYYNKIEADLKNQIIKVIIKVKQASPNADIILTDCQEMRYKGKRTTAAKDFSIMMYDLAKEYHCGFWSYYWVSGGANAWKYWDNSKLTQGDGIHLNGRGSELKGTLLFNAINSTVTAIRMEKINQQILYVESDSTLTSIDSTASPIDSRAVNKDVVENEKLANTNSTKNQAKVKKVNDVYIVRKGDTLGEIALKTKIPVSKIKKLNRLTSDKIKPGQKLMLK